MMGGVLLTTIPHGRTARRSSGSTSPRRCAAASSSTPARPWWRRNRPAAGSRPASPPCSPSPTARAISSRRLACEPNGPSPPPTARRRGCSRPCPATCRCRSCAGRGDRRLVRDGPRARGRRTAGAPVGSGRPAPQQRPAGRTRRSPDPGPLARRARPDGRARRLARAVGPHRPAAGRRARCARGAGSTGAGRRDPRAHRRPRRQPAARRRRPRVAVRLEGSARRTRLARLAVLLTGPRGDGIDVEAHLAAHPLLSAVDPDDRRHRARPSCSATCAWPRTSRCRRPRRTCAATRRGSATCWRAGSPSAAGGREVRGPILGARRPLLALLVASPAFRPARTCGGASARNTRRCAPGPDQTPHHT